MSVLSVVETQGGANRIAIFPPPKSPRPEKFEETSVGFSDLFSFVFIFVGGGRKGGRPRRWLGVRFKFTIEGGR